MKKVWPALVVLLVTVLVGLGWPSMNNPCPLGRRLAVALSHDQRALANAAVRDKSPAVRRAAAAKVSEQDWQATLALTAEDAENRRAAFAKITEQPVLVRVALESTDRYMRLAALEQLSEQGLLAELAVRTTDAAVREAAVRRLTLTIPNDPMPLARVAKWATDEKVARAATTRLSALPQEAGLKAIAEAAEPAGSGDAATELWDPVPATETIGHTDNSDTASDPALVGHAKTLLYSKMDRPRRQVALLDVANPELILALARNDEDLEVRRSATLMLTDQADLKAQAVASHALIREAAVAYVADETFLLHRVLERDEPSPVVRNDIVWALRTQTALAEAACTAYHRDVRKVAAKRVTDPKLLAQIQGAQEAIEIEARAIARGKGPEGLVHLALNGACDDIRLAAAEALQNQDDLAAVALAAADHAVHKVAFGKLTDQTLLKKVAEGAADPVMRFAAAFRTGSRDFADITKALDACYARSSMSPGYRADLAKVLDTLGDAAAAFSLFSEMQASAAKDLRGSFGLLIGQRGESRIPEILDLLALYGDSDVAHACSISTQLDLEDAGIEWDRAQGYEPKPRMGARPFAPSTDTKGD